jgi:hypothetical protein
MKTQIMALFICLSLALSGCAVGMAMSGKPEPNTYVFKEGAYRGEIELQLGSPIETKANDDGTRLDIYEYEIGNSQDNDTAMTHALLDLCTLGAWEIVATPVELMRGEKRYLAVTYDANDRVIRYCSGSYRP